VDGFALEFAGAANVILKIRIAAVDNSVAGLHELRQLLNRLLGCVARWNHHPDRARRGQFFHQIFQRG
jgi:hypothetical protein